MNIWRFIDKQFDRMPGWPSERQWVTIGAFALVLYMLQMAKTNPALWEVEVFKVIVQAVALTGLLNMIFAFHFAANKSDEAKSENTRAAFRAIEATANSNSSATAEQKPDVVLEPGETAMAKKEGEDDGSNG